MNILFVDDEKVISQSLIEFLLSKGHFVKYCDTVMDSHTEIYTNRFDLAIIDLMLPPTYSNEGLDVLSKLKKNNPGMQVIMISQKSEKMTSIVNRAFSIGILAFLDKGDADFMEQLNISIGEI